MATAHAHPTSSRAGAVPTSYTTSTLSNRASFQDDKSRESPRSSLKRMEENKRKVELEASSADQAIFTSQSPPTRSLAQREEGSQTPNSRLNRSNSGNGLGSPRTQLPSFNNLTSNVAAEEEENMAKRRRMEGDSNGSRPQTRDSRAFSSPHQGYEDDDERQYRREMAARQSNRRSERKTHGYSPKRDVEHFEASSMAAPPPLSHSQASSAERRDSAMLVEDGFDSNVPLARRRGDVAHAKASRLHIDTGSNEPSSGGGIGSSLESRKSLSSMSMHGIAKSAPPSKMSFTDRDGVSFDPRGEPPPLHSSSRAYTNGPLASTQPYYPSVYTRKEAAASQENHSFNDASPNHSRRTEYGPQHQQVASQNPSQQHPSHRHALSSVGTPLTAVRSNAFVPQTATLPSPAYHTTQFMRNPMGQEVRGGSSSALGQAVGPPKTAGLNPPQTARLPEHLRSPPSSKTQFLSLFSNFYDSLTDSRTLKATLEDQVRRSNTLLQTLQKSSRVLELTVDRRVREERILWESKVQSLEERCLRLERQLGTATEDVLPPHSVSPAESNGNQKSPSQQNLSRSATSPSLKAEAKDGPESNEVLMDE